MSQEGNEEEHNLKDDDDDDDVFFFFLLFVFYFASSRLIFPSSSSFPVLNLSLLVFSVCVSQHSLVSLYLSRSLPILVFSAPVCIRHGRNGVCCLPPPTTTPSHYTSVRYGTVRCSTRAVQHSQESGFSFCFYCKMTWPHRRRRVWLPAHLAGAAARFSNTKRASLIPIIERNRSTSSLFARLSSSWGLL